MGGGYVATKSAVDVAIDQCGFGRFQAALMLVVGACVVADGAEMLVLSLVNQALTKDWGITSTQRGLLGSSIFVGFFFGSILLSTVSDKFGRRPAFLVAVAGVTVFGIASAFSPSYGVLLAMRTIVGFFIGGAIPIASTYFAEFTPSHLRGAVIILGSAFFAVGEIFVALTAWIVVPDLEDGNWRVLLVVSAFPALLSLIAAAVWLPESPHYLCVVSDRNRAAVLVQQIANSNGMPPLSEEVLATVQWEPHITTRPERGAFKDLFARKLWHTTLLLWILWFAQSFIFYGLIYALPLVFEASHDGHTYLDILFSALAEIPGLLIAAYAIEQPWCGRRRMLWACSLGVFLSTGLSAVTPPASPFFNATAYIAKFFISTSFASIFPATLEIYPTSCRSTGLGYGSAASRIGGILTPVTAEALLAVSKNGPFIAYAVVSAAATLAACALPIETAGKPLVETAEEVHLEEDNLCFGLCGLTPLTEEEEAELLRSRAEKEASEEAFASRPGLDSPQPRAESRGHAERKDGEIAPLLHRDGDAAASEGEEEI